MWVLCRKFGAPKFGTRKFVLRLHCMVMRYTRSYCYCVSVVFDFVVICNQFRRVATKVQSKSLPSWAEDLKAIGFEDAQVVWAKGKLTVLFLFLFLCSAAQSCKEMCLNCITRKFPLCQVHVYLVELSEHAYTHTRVLHTLWIGSAGVLATHLRIRMRACVRLD